MNTPEEADSQEGRSGMTTLKELWESTCYYVVHDEWCGEPAVAVEYGHGRCAVHTTPYLEADRRLVDAAPALLAACKAALEASYDAKVIQILTRAIAQATEAGWLRSVTG